MKISKKYLTLFTIPIPIKTNQKGVVVMCRTIEIMRNESEIKGSIKAYKRVNVPDEKMVAYLLEDFDFLSEEEAKKLISEYED